MEVHRAHRQLEGGGFEVARPLPSMAVPMVDPFLLLDQMGPKDVAPGEAKGAPDHPHRGFETVTYMLSGEMEHRDSHGHHGVLGPGDVQWMTAGSGVIHSEMPSAGFQRAGGRMHGVQLWVNLSAKDKMMRPRYQEIPAKDIPRVDFAGGWIKVLAGTHDVSAVIDTVTPIEYLHAHLEGGAFVHALPEGHLGLLYVLLGEATVKPQNAPATTVPAQHMVLLPQGPVHVEGNADLLWLSGVPLNEPVARYGPFVMNTRAEIQQALDDFHSGRFGTIAGGEPYLPGANAPNG